MTLLADGASNMAISGTLAAQFLAPQVSLHRKSIIGDLVRWVRSHLADLTPDFAKNDETHLQVKELEASEIDIKGMRVLIHLSAPIEVYTRSISIPKSNAQSHERMLALMLHTIAPADPETVICSGVPTEKLAGGLQTYWVAIARRSDLERLSNMARKLGAKDVRFIVDEENSAAPIFLAATSDQVVWKARFFIELFAIILAVGALYWFGNNWAEFETRRLALAKQAETQFGNAARKAIVQERADKAAREALAAAPLLRRPAKAVYDIQSLNTLTPEQAYWRGMEWTPDSLTIQLNAKDGADVVRTMAQERTAFTIDVISDITATNAGRQNVRIRAITLNFEGEKP